MGWTENSQSGNKEEAQNVLLTTTVLNCTKKSILGS